MASAAAAAAVDLKTGEENIVFLPGVVHLESAILSTSSRNSLECHRGVLSGTSSSSSSAAVITAPSFALDYDLGSLELSDYRDRIAYPPSAFIDETIALEQLNDLLKTGQQYISMLYTYRSCSKAIPMVQADTDDATKLDINRQTFAVLRPQIIKLKELMEFHERAVGVVRVNVALVQKADVAVPKQVQSEPLLDLIIDAIDMLVLLDALKDMRAALQNDFSRYKRAFTPIRGELAESDVLSDEIHTLQMFLSNPQQAHNLILSHLKTDIHKVSQYEVVLSLLINHAMDCIEGGLYLLPKELHAYYRVLPHLLYLADSDDKAAKGGFNIFKLSSGDKIKFSLSRIQKLFKSFPIIPLYADMHIDVMFVLRRCHHWEEDTMAESWATARPQKLKERYELLYHHSRIRVEYSEFTARFTTHLNEIQSYTSTKRMITPKMLSTIFSAVLEGLKLLASWSAKICEQAAFKFSRPKNDAEYKAAGGKDVGADGKPLAGVEYDKAVKFNYTSEELYVLIDVIGMLKGLGGLMIESQLIHEPLVRRCIHDDTQIFLQQELARPLRKAHKNKKKVKDVMLHMRDIGCDWSDRAAQHEDYLQKKTQLLQVNRSFHRRAVAPSLTQMHLVRRMMHSVFSPDAPGMSGGIFSGEKDLKKEWIPTWEEFYAKSYYFPYMLVFPETIRTLTDLSYLWFREFYLEVTKSVQFPIGMSMPWMMTEFIITTGGMKENIFFPIDIYNDAASAALYGLKQQFLYDEIEAELNLSFEQLLYALGEDIYKYYKTLASSIIINKSYDSKYASLPLSIAAATGTSATGAAGSKRSGALVESRFLSLMAQRNIQLLGRNVDLHMVLSVSINEYLRKNIEIILKQFESTDLCRGLIDLKLLVENVRTVHGLLSQHLTIDPFNMMWAEVNDSVNLGQRTGRVMLHIFAEIINDILPNFIYSEATQRFVRSYPEVAQQPDRSKPQAGVQSWYWYGKKERQFDRAAAIHYGFFGTDHFEALLSLLTPAEIPVLMFELSSELENKILCDFHPYFDALIHAVPGMKLPKQAYGSVGGHGFFEVKLAPIAAYEPLRPAIFQMLREIGNGVLFVRAMESVSRVDAGWQMQQTTHFVGVRTAVIREGHAGSPIQPPASTFVWPAVGALSPIVATMRDSFANYPNNAAGPLNSSIAGDAIRIAEAALADIFEFERDQGESMLTGMLARLRIAITAKVGPAWNGAASTPDAPFELETPKTLSRLLNCLQFLYCSPPSQDPSAGVFPCDLSTFGESWSWGVCTLIHLVSQRRRFELLDLGMHVVRLEQLTPIDRERLDAAYANKKVKPTAGDHSESRLLVFLTTVNEVKLRHDVIFDGLETYLPPDAPSRFVLRADHANGVTSSAPTNSFAAGAGATVSRQSSGLNIPLSTSSGGGALPASPMSQQQSSSTMASTPVKAPVFITPSTASASPTSSSTMRALPAPPGSASSTSPLPPPPSASAPPPAPMRRPSFVGLTAPFTHVRSGSNGGPLPPPPPGVGLLPPPPPPPPSSSRSPSFSGMNSMMSMPPPPPPPAPPAAPRR